MSGGSMEYLFIRVEEENLFKENTPLRILFRRHLNLVAKALHDIEWVDSDDYGEGKEEEAILDVLNFDTKKEIVAALREQQRGWNRLIDKLEGRQ